MTTRHRTVAEKTSDWLMVFNTIRAEVTPLKLRQMLDGFNEVMSKQDDPQEAIVLLQQSMALARLISANDRAAAISAAILTSSGGARPVLVEDQE